MLFTSLVSFLALAAVGADAHGYVSQIVCDGKKYTGAEPGSKNTKSPIRLISTINPYKDPKGPGQTCGLGAKAGNITAPVTAGSKMTLQWQAGGGVAWPHEMGPMITYMAKVPAGQTADKVDPSKLDFFKVQQSGQTSKGALKWIVAEQMKKGTDYVVNIPKAIANGDYIMRHEIIALHLADKKGGAEFYASCFQLKVTGGTGSGAVSPTAKFPGAYSATDPGIFTPKVFDKGFNYQFPGPAIPSFVAGGKGSNIVGGSNNSTTPSPTESAEPSATPEPTDDCEEEEDPSVSEPASSTKGAHTSTKSGKPTATAKPHNGYRRWGSRMERRFVGSPSS
ncbi:hypothetical protein FRC07_010251 [Ceratobasidium sp. 392]|nr:hypothetical protein FRC07_010251 [Ceratobasidium sp. 392]